MTFSSDDATSSSTRQLESTADDCRVLLEAGSLAIALAIREELERVVTAAAPIAITSAAGAIHVGEVSASDARFKVGLDLARAGACFDPWNSRRFDLASCVHASFGATYVVVQGLVPVAPGSSFVGGGSIGEWFAFRPVRPVALTVGAELGVPIPRYELITRGSERAVFTVAPITLCTFFAVMVATP